MDRALDRQEQEQVRTARAHFFSTHKCKDSPHNKTPESTSSIPTSVTQPFKKRFKMVHKHTTPEQKADRHSKSQLILRFYDPDLKAKDALGRRQEEILSWNDAKLESSHNYIQMLFPLPEGSPYNSEAPVIDLEVMQAFRSRRELRDRLRLSFERMLAFYGFKVSDKSEEELEEEQTKEKAAELETKATKSVDPLLGSAAEALRQQTVDTGSRTLASHVAAAKRAKATETYRDAPIDADTSAPAKCAFPPGSHNNVSAAAPRPYHILRAANWPQAFSNWTGAFDHNHLRISRILRCLRVLGLQTEHETFFQTLELVYTDPDIFISESSFSYWRLAATQSLHIAPDGAVCKWLKGWENEQENLKRSNEETQQQLRNERDGITKEKSVGFDDETLAREAEKEEERLKAEAEEAEVKRQDKLDEDEMRIMGAGVTPEQASFTRD